MAFTLLHTADLHLGKSFSELPPERAGQRRADLLATLQRICRFARERAVDLLVIAGDLFDRPEPAQPLLAAVRQSLAGTVPVLLIPGNHDPLDDGSPYLTARWPANVTVATAPGWQCIAGFGPEIWTFGYARGAAHLNPWREFPGCASDALLVLHAACLAPGLAADAGYYPFTPRDIPTCGYLALGHHHRCAHIAHASPTWYAGSPEPLDAETTQASALLISLDGVATTVEPLDVATRRHRLVALDVTGLDSDDIWERALAQAAADDLLTLNLSGLLDATESLDLPALRAELSARCFAVVVNDADLHLPPTRDTHNGVLGTLHGIGSARLQALPPDDPQRAHIERAIRYAALALEGRL